MDGGQTKCQKPRRFESNRLLEQLKKSEGGLKGARASLPKEGSEGEETLDLRVGGRRQK